MEIKVRPSARIGDYDRGVAVERERIIKLLRETLGFDFGIGIFDLESDCQIDLEMLIALINGENK